MLQKAYFVPKEKQNDESQKVPCLFNPKELNVEKSNRFAEIDIPGLDAPLFQFVRGESRSVTVDLFFDTYEKGEDVRKYTDRITGWSYGEKGEKGLMEIDSELHAPPVCLFVWGRFVFECIIERVSKKFTMFLPEGIPVRATLNVTLKEYAELKMQIKRIDAHSSDLTKLWTVKEGDSLLSIAAREYGDPREWRLIAEANDLDDVRALEAGTTLVLPPKE